MAPDRIHLEAFIRALSEERTPWERAGTVLLEGALRDRLACLGIEPGPDTAVLLMALATLLADAAPEGGGTGRDILAEMAALGLALLDESGPES